MAPYGAGKLRGFQSLVVGKGKCPSCHFSDDEGHGLCHWAPLLMPLGYTGLRKEKGWEKVLVSFIMDLKERCQEVLLPRGTNGDPDGNLTRY